MKSQRLILAMPTILTLAQPESLLWGAADILRGEGGVAEIAAIVVGR